MVVWGAGENDHRKLVRKKGCIPEGCQTIRLGACVRGERICVVGTGAGEAEILCNAAHTVTLWHPSGMRSLFDDGFRWSFAPAAPNDHRLPSFNPPG